MSTDTDDDVSITIAGSNDANVRTKYFASRHYQATVPFVCLRPVASSACTRPSDTTAYAINDAVANSTTAGSVTAFSWSAADENDAPVEIMRCRLQTTCTGTDLVSFRMWLFNGSSPTANAGDNAAFNQSLASYVGRMSGVMRFMTSEGSAILIPDDGPSIICVPTSGAKTIYGLLQTLTAFTPSSAATFTPTLEIKQGRP